MNAYDRTNAVHVERDDELSQESIGVLRAKSTSTDKIEITQQQVSRFLAFLLMAIFLIFLSGYTLGKYRTERYNRGEAVPPLYSIFFETTHAIVPPSQKEGQAFGSEYGLFATFEEADKLCRKLRRNRILAQVVVRNSSTVSGKNIAHYVVCRETKLEKATLDTALNEQSTETLKKGVELHD